MATSVSMADMDAIIRLWRFAKSAYFPDEKQWAADAMQAYLKGFSIRIVSKSNMAVTLAKGDKEFVVSYAGTNDADDVIIALKSLRRVPYPHSASPTFIAEGFFNGFNVVRSEVLLACEEAHREGLNISVTGHSAGAAYALILADTLARQGIICSNVIAFESPRVFGPKLAKRLSTVLKDSRVIRVTHGSDPVPHVPLFFRFRHVGDELWLPRAYGKRAVLNPNVFRQLWGFFKGISQKGVADHKVSNVSPRLTWEHSYMRGLIDGK